MDRPNNDGTLQKLKSKWSDFFGVILSPSVFIILIATIGLIIFSSVDSDHELPVSISNLLIVIISIFSAIAGALISKKWTEINEGSILITRGKSAIRGLMLLLNNLASLEKRVNVYINKMVQNDTNDELTMSSYEEIIEKCSSLQEEALNAVEEWKDIIPEADIKTKIGILSKLKEEKINLEVQIEELSDKVEKTKNQSIGEKSDLSQKLSKKETELKEVKSKLKEKEAELGSSIIGRKGFSRIGYNVERTPNKYKCNDCGEKFQPEIKDGIFASSWHNSNCPNCGSSNLKLELNV